MLSFTSFSIVLLIFVLSWIPNNNAITAPQVVTKKVPTADSVIRSAATSTGAVCTTEACKAIATKFLDGMNQTVDPCDDFYGFSCGGWIAAQTDDDVHVSSRLAETARNASKDLLKGKIKPKGKTFEAEGKVKSLFQQCTNKGEIEKLRGTPAIRIVEEHLGGWPLISPKWNATKFRLVESLVKSHYFGSQPFFSVRIEPDVENPSRNLIILDAPKLWTEADNLQSNESVRLYMQGYFNIIFNVAKNLLRDSNQTNDIHGLVDDVVEFVGIELYLGRNMLTTAEANNEANLLNKFTLRAFKDRFRFNSSLLRNMTECLQSFFAPANLSHAITDDTVIVVPSLCYWPKLDKKLVELEKQGVNGTRRMASYIGWKLIQSLLGYLSEEYMINGDNGASVEDNCLAVINTVMPLALGALYVRDILPYDLKAKATMIVNDIKWGFRALLTEATWMDNVTYEGALHKLAAINEIVVYPDYMANNISVIDSQYAMMTVERTFPRSVLQTKRNNMIQQMKELTMTPRVTDTIDITEPNAYYEPGRNELSVQAAILGLPFFEASAPQYLNYGGIGSTIGHEITHGFDNQGANYDSVGVRRVWWSNKTVDAFSSRADALIAQYNQYTVSTGKVDGALTAGENIADNGGLRASLKGYTRYLQRLTNPEPVLPGMEKFTPLQLFFISAAQAECEKLSPTTERSRLLTDTHAPGKWRVNGPVSNMPEFAQSFNCSSGKKMNPKVKNRVW